MSFDGDTFHLTEGNRAEVGARSWPATQGEPLSSNRMFPVGLDLHESADHGLGHGRASRA